MNQMPPPEAPPPPPPLSGTIPGAGNTPAAPPRGRGCWFYGCIVALLLVVVILATALGTAWWVKRSMSPQPIEPVVLTETESTALEEKLDRLGAPRSPNETEPSGVRSGAMRLEVEPDFVRKPVIISEREINALIGKNTDLADKIRVSLSRDRIQIKANIPIPEDMPFVGGQTFRLNLSTKLVVGDERLTLMLEDIAVGGIPLPNAWIQDIKGRDMLAEMQEDDRLRTVMEGIEKLEVQDGQIVFIPAE